MKKCNTLPAKTQWSETLKQGVTEIYRTDEPFTCIYVIDTCTRFQKNTAQRFKKQDLQIIWNIDSENAPKATIDYDLFVSSTDAASSWTDHGNMSVEIDTRKA